MPNRPAGRPPVFVLGRRRWIPVIDLPADRPATRHAWTTYGFPIRGSGVWTAGQIDASGRWRKQWGRGGQRPPGILPAPDGYTPARPAPKRSARRSKLDLSVAACRVVPTPCCMPKSDRRPQGPADWGTRTVLPESRAGYRVLCCWLLLLVLPV